jgi:chemotaxis receptor (MCP) glutamine deamidase CheD
VTGRLEVRLVVGDVRASRRPAAMRTLLGSCVSACLWDREARIGGMNHFMLPGDADSKESAHFGMHAMDRLIGEMQKLGADRCRLTGKIFGGGAMSGIVSTVAHHNLEFIEHFMEVEQIPVVAKDLGGTWPRQLIFLTDTGQVFVKKLHGKRQLKHVAAEDRRLAAPAPLTYGGITLFVDEPPAQRAQR